MARASRYPRKEDVIRRILELELAGESLHSREVQKRQGGLDLAARRHFGSWRKALCAAGLDDGKVCRQRQWTDQRIVAAIQRLARQGVPLNSGSVRRVDGGLRCAALKHLGSWEAALRAAGIDPRTVRCRQPRWTAEEVLQAIRRQHQQNLSPQEAVAVRRSVESAAQRLFGSWKAAVRAAGVPNPFAESPRWTKVSVVEAILRRRQQGRSLSPGVVYAQCPLLHGAARRAFGTWDAALEAAGIDPDSVRRYRRPHTPEDILAYLEQARKDPEFNPRPGRHPGWIVQAASRLFGSWRKALGAAVIPDNYPPRGPYGRSRHQSSGGPGCPRA